MTENTEQKGWRNAVFHKEPRSLKFMKVAYYNMPNGLDFENELLREWKIPEEELSLEEVTGRDPVSDLKGYAGLVTEYTDLGEEQFSRLPDLRIISLQSIGYDEIDTKAARAHHIDVTNAPGYCAEDVATHAMALLLAFVRQIPMFDTAVRDGKWDPYQGRTMYRLSGKHAGLISFGHIPQIETKMLQGFGLEVGAFDPLKDAAVMEQLGVRRYDTLEDLLKDSDFVFIHTPLFPSTYHLIGEKELGCMKQNAVLLNVSRGAIVDEKALIQALKEQKIAGACVDVLEDEAAHDSELLKLPNTVITPHVGFLSEDSLKQSRRMALEELCRKLVKGAPLKYCVNKR